MPKIEHSQRFRLEYEGETITVIEKCRNPECSAKVQFAPGMNYCQNCGEAIEWTKTDATTPDRTEAVPG